MNKRGRERKKREEREERERKRMESNLTDGKKFRPYS